MFKVGNFVMVRKDLVGGLYYSYESNVIGPVRSVFSNSLYFATEMERFRGKIYRVTRILYKGENKQYNLSIGEEESEWVFNDGMLMSAGGLNKLVWKRKNLK